MLCTKFAIAQYDVKTFKQNTGETVTYTVPSYKIPNYTMFTSFYYFFFQKIGDKYYVSAEYVAWNIPNLDPSKITSTTYVFRDGFELVIPTSLYFKKTINEVPEYNGNWAHYGVTCYISNEQMEIFTKKQLLSIANNFKDIDRKFDAFVPQKKSFQIAMSANYLLTGEKVKEDDLAKRFALNKCIEPYNSNKWDF